MNKDKQRGFTLIELLVVIAIIGILATLLLVQFGNVRAKGRDTDRLSDITNLRTAIEISLESIGTAPTNLSDLVTAGYISLVPKDPQGGDYKYAYQGSKYHLGAELEAGVTGKGALVSDSDINSAGWSGAPFNGTTEACTATADDCIFDLGQK